MWGNQRQWSSVLIQGIWVIHETLGIQTHYHQYTLPTTKWARWKTVQRVKNLLTKEKKDNRDPYLGLLEYRNTPIDEFGSPAQVLMSRRLRSIIATTEAQLQPTVLDPNKVKQKLRLNQEKQKYYFDQHTKQLPVLEKRRADQGRHGKALGTRGGSETCRNT